MARDKASSLFGNPSGDVLAAVLDASIDGNEIARPNWNLLLDYILILAMKSLVDFRKMHQLCPVNMVQGRGKDEGYDYLEEVNISVQGQDANAACLSVMTVAQGLGTLAIISGWRSLKFAPRK